MLLACPLWCPSVPPTPASLVHPTGVHSVNIKYENKIISTRKEEGGAERRACEDIFNLESSRNTFIEKEPHAGRVQAAYTFQNGGERRTSKVCSLCVCSRITVGAPKRYQTRVSITRTSTSSTRTKRRCSAKNAVGMTRTCAVSMTAPLSPKSSPKKCKAS